MVNLLPARIGFYSSVRPLTSPLISTFYRVRVDTSLVTSPTTATLLSNIAKYIVLSHVLSVARVMAQIRLYNDYNSGE